MVFPYINTNPPRCTRVPNPEHPLSHLPPHNISLGHPSAPAPSMLYPASDIDWQVDSCMIVYQLQCHSPKSSHPLPLPLSPKVRYTISFKTEFKHLTDAASSGKKILILLFAKLKPIHPLSFNINMLNGLQRPFLISTVPIKSPPTSFPHTLFFVHRDYFSFLLSVYLYDYVCYICL